MSSAMGGSDFIRGRKNVSQSQKQRDRRFFVSFSVCMHLVRIEIDSTLPLLCLTVGQLISDITALLVRGDYKQCGVISNISCICSNKY